jgi:drug/metabolite transporter (DMT)-like permease
MLFALGSMFCYAINILITRVAIQRAPVELGFVALLCANIAFAGLVFGVLAPFRETTFALDWPGIGWFALSGLAGIYFGRRALLDAVRVLGPSRASVLHTASPVSTLLAAWILVGERLGPYELSLMALVVCGLWLTQPRAVAGAPRDPDALRRGVILGVVTVACFGIGNAIRGIAIRTWDEPAAGAVVGSLAALLAVLLTTRDHRGLATRLLAADRRGLALYALGGVITVIGTMLGSLAMVRTEIAVAMLVTYITPVVVFPVSVFILKTRESITGRTLVGAALVLGGVAALAAR